MASIQDQPRPHPSHTRVGAWGTLPSMASAISFPIRLIRIHITTTDLLSVRNYKRLVMTAAGHGTMSTLALQRMMGIAIQGDNLAMTSVIEWREA
jgi:hypothetical protein